MWILIASLITLFIIALILGYYRNQRIKVKIEKGELNEYPEAKEVDAECCGQHATCEKDSLLAAVSKSVEYYDDEELDEYQGIPSDEYTEDQIERFKEIFYTMQEVDVAGWNRSLQLRGINLPDELKDEVFLVVGERRYIH